MFSGCVNKRSESVDVMDVKKELSEWFPDQKGPYHVKNIHECQYLCTIRPMEIRHLIYFANYDFMTGGDFLTGGTAASKRAICSTSQLYPYQSCFTSSE
jgi:hypothetical protein